MREKKEVWLEVEESEILEVRREEISEIWKNNRLGNIEKERRKDFKKGN